jgi:hypothetical protein
MRHESPATSVQITAAALSTKFAAAPIRRRHADGALKLSAEMVHVAKAASVRDLCQWSVATDHQRLSMGKSFALEPLSRGYA